MRALLSALVFLLWSGDLPAYAVDGVPAYADLLADCAAAKDSACAGEQAILAAQWPKALSGNLLSLRNFAFCLSDSCYGALKVDPVKACALRIVVAAIANDPVQQADRDNFDQACGPLGPEDQQTAKITAREVVRAIRRARP
ncbi:MAG: hypothetical protein H6R00_640 [Proteobacteria bacterium]|nr:hypothetical protein [Pseudomonadota bacterium]